jgi:predicted PurR-regulated permease PerM
VRLVRELARTIALYVRGQIRIVAILAALYLTGFALVRVPAWPLWGVLAGFLNPVPFAGVVFGLLLPLVSTWAERGELWQILGVVGVFTIVQSLEGFVITPRILGKSLGIGPLTIFLCALAGGALFGPLGVLLAAPVAALAAVTWRFMIRRA